VRERDFWNFTICFEIWPFQDHNIWIKKGRERKRESGRKSESGREIEWERERERERERENREREREDKTVRECDRVREW